MGAQQAPGDVGSRLREARERRGLTLRQIANATKISVLALEGLEKNDVARLPGGIFSRSFVRSYALEVGLDPDEMIEAFLAQFGPDSAARGHRMSDRADEDLAVESDRRAAMAVLLLVVISVPLELAVLYFASAGRPAASGGAAEAVRVAGLASRQPP
jgi:cytoskeletal protein RodZ